MTRDRTTRAACAAALLAVGLAVYANSLDGVFTFDDQGIIADNPAIRSIQPLWGYQQHASPLNGRPLVRLSLAANYALGGLDPYGYHVANIAAHLFCALLFYLLVLRTLDTALRGGAPLLAFFCALLWLVHPLQSQCVNYITQRSESIMAAMYLLTLYSLNRTLCTGRTAWTLAACAACALGMLSKESMVTAPVVALLYDRTYYGRSYRAILRQRWRLYAGLGATWALLWLMIRASPHSDLLGPEQKVTAWNYLLSQAQILTSYLHTALWPRALVHDYGLPWAATPAEVWPEALLVASLLGLAAWAYYRHPLAGFPALAFFIILSPVSSIVPMANEVGAERRMYLPMLALALLCALAGRQLAAAIPRRVGLVLAGALLCALAYRTALRNLDYRDNVVLWQTAVAARPANPRAHDNLGVALYAAGRRQEAIRHYQAALRLDPRNADAHSNLGVALYAAGQRQEAIRHYSQALQLDPRNADAHSNLGVALYDAGQRPEAIRHYQAALLIKPAYYQAHNNLGMALYDRGDYPTAIGHFRQALAANPQSAEAHNNLGMTLYAAGDPQSAFDQFRRALALNAAYAAAHNNIAVLYEESGALATAIRHYRQALQLQPDYADARANLDAALAKAGRPGPSPR